MGDPNMSLMHGNGRNGRPDQRPNGANLSDSGLAELERAFDFPGLNQREPYLEYSRAPAHLHYSQAPQEVKLAPVISESIGISADEGLAVPYSAQNSREEQK